MQCPNDQTPLAMTDRQGIEIDYCPICRGVWLDKGELDKLISGSENNTAPAPSHPGHQSVQNQPQPYRDDRPAYSDNNGHYKKKKKESFLGELFDF